MLGYLDVSITQTNSDTDDRIFECAFVIFLHAYYIRGGGGGGGGGGTSLYRCLTLKTSASVLKQDPNTKTT